MKRLPFIATNSGLRPEFRQPERDPFFAIIGRDGAQLLVKSENNVPPLPNSTRHPSMRWDAFIYASEPDALAAELADQGVVFSAPLKDTHDGLRGFEICDPVTATFCSSDDQDNRARG